ncbi:MAG: hypothetical protein JW982_01590 [Spirochaetes bacterium]|nr:hypothetical protein [Spirochaetota bacterium]
MKKLVLLPVYLILLSGCSMKTGKADFNENEKNIFFKIEDFNEFLDKNFQGSSDEASFFSFIIPFSGIRVYTYELNYGRNQNEFYIQNSVIVTEKKGMKPVSAGKNFFSAFKKKKIELAEISELPDINAKIYTLSINGSLLGNFIIYDKGNFSGAVTISGICFDEENVYLLENLVKQKVYAVFLLEKHRNNE